MVLFSGGRMRRPPLQPRRKPKPKPRPRPVPKPVPVPVDRGPVPNPGGTTTPAPSTTTTTTDTTGLPGSAAGQLAQDAGQLEGEQAAAAAYETQQPMVTTPSTTAPANAYQNRAQAQAQSNDALQSFFSTGAGDAVHYHPGQTYATEVAASTGMENNPT